ncbi:MAG: phage/plasmid primase, P4 family [Clostridia bacterium]
MDEQVDELDILIFNKIFEFQIETNEEFTLDDTSAGRLFNYVFSSVLRFNSTSNCFFHYNGKVWKIDNELKSFSYATRLTDFLLSYASLSIQDKSKQDIYFKYFGKLRSRGNLEKMIEMSKSIDVITENKLDTNLYIFNCQNGTYNLETKTFLPHNPNDLLSKISSVVYDDNKDCQNFKKFLDDITEANQEKKDYILKILAYSLSGNKNREYANFTILFGKTTRNGKSTLCGIISKLMGANEEGYSIFADPSLIEEQLTQAGNASPQVARLKASRLVIISEPKKSSILDIAKIKNWTSSSSVITARQLYGKTFQFTPNFNIILDTNYLPSASDDTLFTSDRVKIIEFNRHFKPEEQDINLLEKLTTQDEISGIFNLLIKYRDIIQKDGIIPPLCISNATLNYANISDKLGNWISETLDKTVDKNISVKSAFLNYSNWCKSNNFGAENKTNFIEMLKQKDLVYDRLYYNETKTEKKQGLCIKGHSYKKD